jgi:hypothetical protein
MAPFKLRPIEPDEISVLGERSSEGIAPYLCSSHPSPADTGRGFSSSLEVCVWNSSCIPPMQLMSGFRLFIPSLKNYNIVRWFAG